MMFASQTPHSRLSFPTLSVRLLPTLPAESADHERAWENAATNGPISLVMSLIHGGDLERLEVSTARLRALLHAPEQQATREQATRKILNELNLVTPGVNRTGAHALANVIDPAPPHMSPKPTPQVQKEPIEVVRSLNSLDLTAVVKNKQQN